MLVNLINNFNYKKIHSLSKYKYIIKSNINNNNNNKSISLNKNNALKLSLNNL